MFNYLEFWGRELRSLIQIHHYDMLFTQSRIPNGAWIFADLERLSLDETDRLQRYYEAARSAGCPVYNEPRAFQDRYDILKARANLGLSHKNVYRIDESLDHIEYPVFIRITRDHYSVSTELGLICDSGVCWNDRNAQVTKEYYESLLRLGADRVMSYVAVEMAQWLAQH